MKFFKFIFTSILLLAAAALVTNGTRNALAAGASAAQAIKLCLGTGGDIVGRTHCRANEKALEKSNLKSLLGVEGPRGPKGDTGNTGAPGASGLRFYYLTQSGSIDGSTALTACASGFHMASFWELYNLSELTYDTANGASRGDDGNGPPAGIEGWVRTGNAAGDGIQSAGVANCNGYTTNGGTVYGTAVELVTSWQAGSTLGPFSVGSFTCTSSQHVWCVED